MLPWSEDTTCSLRSRILDAVDLMKIPRKVLLYNTVPLLDLETVRWRGVSGAPYALSH